MMKKQKYPDEPNAKGRPYDGIDKNMANVSDRCKSAMKDVGMK